MTEGQIKQKAEQKYKEHLADPNYCENSEEESFYTGYTEGYLECQKANDWQYVSEKGTPQKEGHYLVCLRNKDRDIFDCWIYYDKDVGWYSMKVRIKDIYAWKEIIPPSLDKEKENDKKMTMQELSDEMRKERARCSTHCGTWNSEDRDCEIYGEYHCPPSKCRYFLATELARRNEEIKDIKVRLDENSKFEHRRIN